MKNKKIRVFLGGYVNFQNAQNLNCKALSERLDKDKFVVSTMLFPFSFRSDFLPMDGVRYLQLRRPVRLYRYWTYLKGIATSDLAYLPKFEINTFCSIIAKVFNTKRITTLEGIQDKNLQSRLGHQKFQKNLKKYAKFEPNLYSITKYIAERESVVHNLKFDKDILYLGVNSKDFIIDRKRKYKRLKNIIFIGNDPIRKNIQDFFDGARQFPDINFHIVGGGQLKNDMVSDYIKRNNLNNVTYHGPLNHSEMSTLLTKIDLMYFPSRSEGFPKVHLETACAGVPTLCYSDYGASEWIVNGKNGIIVNTKEEAIEAIKDLQENPQKLKELSVNAIELGKSFDWRILVKKWEEVFERVARGK